jgi:GntP family gluconate:H+ symporter
MTPTWVTLGIVLLGVVVVVVGVLALRLHAFLALMLGAILVGTLTPQASLERFFVRQSAITVIGIDPEGRLEIEAGLEPGTLLRVLVADTQTGRFRVAGNAVVETIVSERGERAVAVVSDGEALPDDERADNLLVIRPADFDAARRGASRTVGSRIADGFGRTCGGIGVLIAMAAIVGKCLLDSGAADRIVRTALRWTGEPGAPLAFTFSGFLLGIPVFFDTVFYLMLPLGKALRARTGRNYLVYVLTIICGATMAHSLVPPTPGPLFVAEELGVSLATMIVGGTIVGLACGIFGYGYALLAGRIWDLPLRATGETSLEELAAAAEVDESQLPPLWLSVAPIAVPVALISAQAVAAELSGGAPAWLNVIGEKNIALALAAAIGLAMLVWRKRQSLRELAGGIGTALESAGMIILITAAGGAFGTTLQQSGVADLIQELPRTSPAMICTLAFLVTTAVRTAQGSATVAMITAVGILSGLARSGELGFHPVYLALSIGCGSKPLAWMNDSGFWVITRMTGMTEVEGLKYITPMTALMGVLGLVLVVVGVTLWPMG